MIHATSLIDRRAELDRGVSVGPYSIIGPEVCVAAGTEIGAHVVIEGRVSIGARCRIGHGALIGGVPQDLKYREGAPVGVRIGDDTAVREYVTIHRATREGGDTRVGDHCLVMASSHVAHDCAIGNHVIIINYAGLTGHVVVDDHATVGGLTGVRPFVRIGTHAYVGGCSKVVQDVPPFIMVDGAPATARAVNVIGMRRGGIDGEGRRQVKAAFRLLYRSGLAPGTALARIKAELGDHRLVSALVAFIEASTLGIVPAGAGGMDEEGRAEP
jgi:UDP-N-acetylglucosamine acyltransferase